ncbi:MAG: hypothetical protein HY831_00380 [Candidatus Aenigmarchaeota archaeon]|nr:hypothetical protein [Candidatus Aenigmarchaeota archaeon]
MVAMKGVRPSIDVYKVLLPSLEAREYSLVEDREAIERHYRGEPISCTTGFERNRERVRSSLVNLFDDIWEEYGLPRENIIEYGSGATGYYDAFLRPRNIKNWLQIEINPTAIAENRRRNPRANIVEGSYNDIQYKNVPMITGLSSFDTSENLYHAMNQVATALESGGYFLHVQDVRPGVTTVLNYLHKKGINSKTFLGPSKVVCGDMLAVINGNPVPTVDIFRDALGDAIKSQPNLDLVENTYFTLIESNGKLTYEVYDANVYLEIPLHNLLSFGDIDEVGHLIGRREVCVLATIARKK